MSPENQPLSRFIGCGVGKDSIAIFDSHGGRATTIPNTPERLAAFAATLSDSCFLVCEATGGSRPPCWSP